MNARFSLPYFRVLLFTIGCLASVPLAGATTAQSTSGTDRGFAPRMTWERATTSAEFAVPLVIPVQVQSLKSTGPYPYLLASAGDLTNYRFGSQVVTSSVQSVPDEVAGLPEPGKGSAVFATVALAMFFVFRRSA